MKKITRKVTRTRVILRSRLKRAIPYMLAILFFLSYFVANCLVDREFNVSFEKIWNSPITGVYLLILIVYVGFGIKVRKKKWKPFVFFGETAFTIEKKEGMGIYG